MARGRPLLLVIALLLAAALAGCGSPASAVARPPARPPDALARIRAAGVLRVAIREDAPPMGFRRPGSLQPEGFEVDLGRALAAALLGDPNKVAWVPVGSGRLVALDAGAADVDLAGIAPSPELAARYRLSPPYYRSQVVLIARRGTPYEGLQSLDGRMVATVPEDGGAGAMLAAAAKSKGVTVLLSGQPNAAAAVAAVQSGEAAAMVTVRALAPAWLLTDPQLRMWRPGVGSVAYVAAVRADEPDLAAFVDTAVRDLVGGPTLRAMLRRWGLPAP
jgi:putative glutamine transport system substrate-binding protein